MSDDAQQTTIDEFADEAASTDTAASRAEIESLRTRIDALQEATESTADLLDRVVDHIERLDGSADGGATDPSTDSETEHEPRFYQ